MFQLGLQRLFDSIDNVDDIDSSTRKYVFYFKERVIAANLQCTTDTILLPEQKTTTCLSKCYDTSMEFSLPVSTCSRSGAELISCSAMFFYILVAFNFMSDAGKVWIYCRIRAAPRGSFATHNAINCVSSTASSVAANYVQNSQSKTNFPPRAKTEDFS